MTGTDRGTGNNEGPAGSLTDTDERGKPIAMDVSGSGWADRQWGDFLADQRPR